MITVTHTYEIVAGSPEEYATILSQVEGYKTSGLNPGEGVVSQKEEQELNKITLVIKTTTGAI